MRLPLARGVIAVIVLGACSRYEWVPDYLGPECRGFHRPLSDSPLRWETSSPDSAAVLRGQVIVAGGGDRLSDAVLWLSTVPPQTVVSDSLGYFRFTHAASGTYVLRTRRIGTLARVDTVALPTQPDVRAVLSLERDVNDGPCSGFGVVPVRKPWWKFW